MQISSAVSDTGSLPSHPAFSPDPSPFGSQTGDERIASALRLRLCCIEEEIGALEDSHEQLTEALHEVELRIAHRCWGRA